MAGDQHPEQSNAICTTQWNSTDPSGCFCPAKTIICAPGLRSYLLPGVNETTGVLGGTITFFSPSLYYASYLAPPAQIRTCSFPAYGSHLGYPRRLYAAVCEPASLTRLCGAESGACVAGPHSPWSPPFAPPAPQRFAPLCSSASQLLWRSATSRARASSATAPHLPDADHPSHSTLTASHEISQLPTRSFCA